MPSVYTGRKPLYLLRPRFGTIMLGAMGTALSGVGIPKEPAQFFLREAASIAFKKMGDKSVNQTIYGHYYGADIKIPSLQTSWVEYKNALLLSTTLVQGTFGINAVNGGAFNLNFIDNAGGQDPIGGTVPATGSALLGVIPTLTIDDNACKLDIECKTELWDGEYDWMMDSTNTGTASLGSSGGTALGITAQTYNRANNLRGGVADFLVAGASVGIRKKATKLSITSADGGGGDHKNRPLCDLVKIKLEITTRQLMADLKTGRYFGVTDAAYQINLASGYTILFDAGVLQMTDEATIDEKDPLMKLTFEGDVVYPNSFTTTPDTIDCGVTTPTQLHFLRYGY